MILGNKLQWNFNQNLYIFLQENAFENVVWKMAVILPLPQGDKAQNTLWSYCNIVNCNVYCMAYSMAIANVQCVQIPSKSRSSLIYWHESTLIPAWKSNDRPCKVYGETTYSFPNFHIYTMDVCEWISNSIIHFIMDVMTYPCWDLS